MGLDISDISGYKEGFSVPAAGYQVILIVGGQEFDISEFKLSDPSIVDAADYQEGLSYINEISIEFDNFASIIYDETGLTRGSILNTTLDVEMIVNMYLNIPGFSMEQKLLHKVRKFGGYVKKEMLRTNNITKTVEITAKSYLGIMEERSGYRLVTQDFGTDGLGNSGLKLTTAAAYLLNANISGFPLKRGIHKVYSKFEAPSSYLKLDDGDWVLDTGGALTLVNSDGTQKVSVNAYSNVGTPEEVFSLVVVLNEGDQFPYILYRDPSLVEMVEKCFSVCGVTDFEIEPFEVKTYDDDNRWSPYPPIRFPNWNGWIGNCAVSDGARFVYCGLGNELWRRDLHFQRNVKMHTYDTDEEVKRIIYSAANNCIFVFTEGAGAPFRSLYKVDLTTFNSDNIFNRFDNLGIKTYNSIQWSAYLNKFIFVRSATVIASLDVNGVITNIHTGLTSAKPNGTSWLYENDIEIQYVYVRRNPGDTGWHWYKTKYNKVSETWSTPAFFRNLVHSGISEIDPELAIAYTFQSEGKVFLSNAIIDEVESVWITINCETGAMVTFYSGGVYSFHSPIEHDGKLYLLVTWSDQKLATLQNDVLTYISTDYDGSDLYENALEERNVQRIFFHKNWKNVDILNIQGASNFIMLRYSNYVVPYMSGDQDFTDQTAKDAIQEIANTFLGFLRINAYKRGWFTSRGGYTTGRSITFKADYIQARGREVVYNEQYDGVEISNDLITEGEGSFGPEDNILSLNYPRLPSIILKDIVKYCYDYYNVERHIISITYLPTFLESEPMDSVLFEGLDIDIVNPRVHEYAPGRSAAEYRVISEVANG